MDNDSFSHDQDIVDILKGLESRKAEYPPELLTARRKLFLEQLEKHPQVQAADELVERDWKLLEVFRSLKALEPEYPPAMLAHRRSLFKQQVLEAVRNTIWTLLRSSIRKFIAGGVTPQRSVSMKLARAVTLAVGVAMIAFVAFALYGNTIQSTSSFLPQSEIFTSTPGQEASATPQAAAIICAENDESSLCRAVGLDKSRNIAYTGNGNARPAVAKDSIPGDGQLHGAAHINDGLYGLSASWVSNSPNSWIKIDLGMTTTINTVTFGRNRLGMLNEGDPGRFVIAVAIVDDVYADGNSSNDEREYVQVFDSDLAGFDGTISGAETVVALFDLNQVRFIKITFENARTVIDEVEAFVSDPFLAAMVPTKASVERETHPNPSTPLPANTPVPTDTATAVPIDTLPPTDTPVPTNTPPPAETPTPVDTPTPIDPTVPPPTDASMFTPTAEPVSSNGQIVPVPDDTPESD